MVLTGNKVQDLFKKAKKNKFALPAVNVIGSNSINATLETAAKLNSPVIIQFSNGGAIFNAGKSLSNENQIAAIIYTYTISTTSDDLLDELSANSGQTRWNFG